MQRRKLLALGAVSAAVLAVGGGAVAVLQPGLRESRLSPGGREVFVAAGRALLEGSLPDTPEALQGALEALLVRVDAVVAALPPHAQSELSQLLALLSTAGGRRALAGLAEPWPRAATADVQQALQGMRTSAISLRQQAYQALHDIVGGAYFSDAQTWGLLGYPGPRVI
ncbi:MAG TPA: hypothetical protein VK981_16320 [Ramlibacter sp.]|nr:hypothetical protein [Ramlibacter sp.]